MMTHGTGCKSSGDRFAMSPVCFAIVISFFLWAGSSNVVAIGSNAGASNSQDLDQVDSKERDSASDEVDKQVSDLIQQLGDDNYIFRNKAEVELTKIGGPALPLLKIALRDKGSDNEVRLRVTRLLIVIERKVKAEQLQGFISAEHDTTEFEGWQDFSQLVGGSTNARRLFLRVHESQADLLKIAYSTELSNLEKRKRLSEKYRLVASSSLYLGSSSNGNRIIGSLAAVLFLSGREIPDNDGLNALPLKVSEDTVQRIRKSLAQSQAIRTIKNSAGSKEMISLIDHWLETLPDVPESYIANKISAINTYEIKNKTDMLMKYATNKSVFVRTRAAAFEALSKLGTDENSDRLKSLFEEETIVGNFLPIKIRTGFDSGKKRSPKLIEVQIRDLALACVLLLKQKDVSQFGFLPTTSEEGVLLFSQAGFESEDLRNAAFEKWNVENRGLAEN